jgi:hypothetical protein
MPTKKERGFNRETLEKAFARLISLPAAYCEFSQENKYKQARARLIRLHSAYAASVEAKCNAENRLVSHGDAEFL